MSNSHLNNQSKNSLLDESLLNLDTVQPQISISESVRNHMDNKYKI